MIIAITVFTIFVGVAMGTYLSFHRAQQEAVDTRALLLEMEAIMAQMTDAIQENAIDYEAYTSSDPTLSDALSQAVSQQYGFDVDGSAVLSTNTLRLLSPDGASSMVFDWDDATDTLSLQRGASDAVRLHSESLQVSHLSFDIFPDRDPYDSAHSTDDQVQYQPMVQIHLEVSGEGRVREVITLDLQTSVTTRVYQ